MKAGWWDTRIALWGLAEAIPITSDNGLPLLSENNFQPPPFPFPFHLDPPLLLLIFRLSDRLSLPLLFRPYPTIWNWRVIDKVTRYQIRSKCKISKYQQSIKYDQIHQKLWIWLHLLKNSWMQNLIFCVAHGRVH